MSNGMSGKNSLQQIHIPTSVVSIQ